MLVSSEFCEKHLQLIFTMLEKATEPIIRANLIIALGDLSFRSVFADAGVRIPERANLSSGRLGSVVDPDPHGSGTFAWIRIQNYSSGSGSSKK